MAKFGKDGKEGLDVKGISEPALGYGNDWKHKDNCG